MTEKHKSSKIELKHFAIYDDMKGSARFSEVTKVYEKLIG